MSAVRPAASRSCPLVTAILCMLAGHAAVQAQGLTGPTVADSTVGYIDNAIPGNVFRLRFDAGYNMNRPNRAEFFYAQGAPGGRGLPLAEKRVDYQDLSAYAEYAPAQRWSVFIAEPLRMLNPEVNRNHTGMSDLDTGVKYALIQDEMTVASFQFRTYVPTGNPHLGLGTGHVSLEPAFLLFQRLTDRLALAGELRYWVPVGGSDFAGDIIRYGLGLQYLAYQGCRLKVTPVTEFIGWTVLSGREGEGTGVSAAGDTIVNVKVGCRWGFSNRCDMYTGLGQVLTGERWYAELFRTELRFLY